MLGLNNDVVSYIFSLLKPNVIYFTISKQIYYLRHQYLILHMNRFHIKIPKDKDPTITCLLYYGDLKTDAGKYIKYILEFMSNKNRKQTYLQPKNSYYRKFVHQFCDTQGLLHETIDSGIKGKYVCKNCKSDNIIISFDYNYNVYCKDCRYSVYSENHPEDKALFTHKKIKISKSN